jgi:hypothetical protein
VILENNVYLKCIHRIYQIPVIGTCPG